MDETQWDIQEVKHLKKKQLVQNNLVMLLVFVLIGYLAENGNTTILFGVLCVLLWITVAITLYILTTGKPIGTKTSRRLQLYDRVRFGEPIWKRRKIVEIVIISIIGVLVTVLVFVEDVNAARFDFPVEAFPFLGAWIGYNIGEFVRMRKLQV